MAAYQRRYGPLKISATLLLPLIFFGLAAAVLGQRATFAQSERSRLDPIKDADEPLVVASVDDAIISTTIDQARLIGLPPRAATLILGTPLIADVSFANDRQAVIIGKGYGVTNLFVLDSDGAVLMQKLIQVDPPPNVLVVYNGVGRETFSCSPHQRCAPRATLGDSDKFFTEALTQIRSRSEQALGIAPSSDKDRQGSGAPPPGK